jgi:hypothetical protein
MFMKKGLSCCLMLVFSIVGLGGCTHPIVPEAVMFKAKQLPIVKTEHSVSVITLQVPTPKQFIVHSHGVHKYVVRTDDMNNRARTSLEDMLRKNNVALTDNALKKLEVAVVSADCPVRGFVVGVVNCTLKIQARAGGNAILEFTGEDVSASFEVSISEAINNALEDMLKDKEILQYLAE